MYCEYQLQKPAQYIFLCNHGFKTKISFGKEKDIALLSCKKKSMEEDMLVFFESNFTVSLKLLMEKL